MNFNDLDMETLPIEGSTFTFSGVRPEELANDISEGTIVNLLIDTSGSVIPFSDDLYRMLQEVVRACKKSPKSDNLLLRVTTFNSAYKEEHGYVGVNAIDENNYDPLSCGGYTSLVDACFSAVGSTREYAKGLDDSDIMTNAIMFIITDGADNNSVMTESRLKEEIQKLFSEEILDSFISILIGVNTNDSEIKKYLSNFKDNVGIDQFIDMGEVTASKLAKLGGFISKSISSQSQSLGSQQSIPVSLTF